MTIRSTAAAMVIAALFTVTPARAQQAVVSLTPEDPARWEISVHAGWFGGNKSEIAPDWNRWYDAASFGAGAGYYWTPHVKVELDVATTAEGQLFSQEQIVVADHLPPVFRSREYFFRSTMVAGGVSYQFLDNSWFHPFTGGGFEVGRETVRIETPPQFLFGRDGQPPGVVAALEPERDAQSWVRPFVSAGFKWYLSEKAFLRSDLRATISTQQVETVTWRGGVGFDF